MKWVTVVDGASHAKGKPMQYRRLSLPQILDQTVEKYGDHTAVHFYETEISYRQLQNRTRLAAGALKQIGVKKGDRIGLMLTNCPQYVTAFYGILRCGAIVVQVNPMYREREIEFVLQDSGADVLIVLSDLYPRVKNMARFSQLKKVIVVKSDQSVSLDMSKNSALWDELLDGAVMAADELIDPEQDVAVFQYTGGTTGRSKGAMLTHYNLVTNVLQLNDHSRGNSLSDTDRILIAIPLFHIYGMTCAMNLGILNGSTVILLPRFEPLEVLQMIKKHRPTYFPGVPTMYVALNSFPKAEQYGIDSIRICNSGSAPIPVELIQSFEKKTGASMYEGYGLSEASPTTHNTPRTGQKKPGSVGIPLPGTEARIVDLETGTKTLPVGQTGELVIRGPQVMKGYWNMQEETRQALRDGWLFTGDIARMDEDGFFYIVDRKKDLIIAGGYNIYPREIEEVLYTHPAVLEAAVVGVVDPYRGETVKAFIVRKPGARVSSEEIEHFCRKHLASFKVPRQIEFRASLPKTVVGKILRRVLAEEEKQKRGD